MNLHGMVRGAITTVNPDVPVTIKQSNGYTKNAQHQQVPAYITHTNIPAQIQALTYKDLQQVDGINEGGVTRAIYFYGNVDAIIRNSMKGGDLITFPDGTVWLVKQSLEQWPDWCKVAVVQQNGA